MSKRMYAEFTDKAYEDLRNGKAVDNNGFRSCKGNFYPDQPKFYPMNERKERMKDAATDIGINIIEAVAYHVLIPKVTEGLTWVVDVKITPFFKSKLNALKGALGKQTSFQGQQCSSNDESKNPDDEPSRQASNIVQIDSYRKAQ